MKWLNTAAFAILIIGGLNYLLMGIMGFNLVAFLFGSSLASGILYSLFGLSAVLLLCTIIARAILNDNKSNK
jgi:uncharacterized membrane protein YuzA (DUF378 family)